MLLAEHKDAAGAKAAYQTAMDSGHLVYAPRAELLLGEQCTEDLNARRLHREHAAASADKDLLVSIAELYAVEGDLNSSKRLLNQASSAGLDYADNFLKLLEGHGSGLVAPSTIADLALAESSHLRSHARSESSSPGPRCSLRILAWW